MNLYNKREHAMYVSNRMFLQFLLYSINLITLLYSYL